MHNLVPHHHHDAQHNHTGNLPVTNHDDCEDHNNDLRHLFAHLVHAEEGFTFLSVSKNPSTGVNDICYLLPSEPVYFISLNELEFINQIIKPPPEVNIHSQVLLSNHELRGPPAI